MKTKLQNARTTFLNSRKYGTKQLDITPADWYTLDNSVWDIIAVIPENAVNSAYLQDIFKITSTDSDAIRSALQSLGLPMDGVFMALGSTDYSNLNNNFGSKIKAHGQSYYDTFFGLISGKTLGRAVAGVSSSNNNAIVLFVEVL